MATNAPMGQPFVTGIVPADLILAEEMMHVTDFQAFALSVKDSLDYLEETPYESKKKCEKGCAAAMDWFIDLLKQHIAIVDSSHPEGY